MYLIHHRNKLETTLNTGPKNPKIGRIRSEACTEPMVSTIS